MLLDRRNIWQGIANSDNREPFELTANTVSTNMDECAVLLMKKYNEYVGETTVKRTRSYVILGQSETRSLSLSWLSRTGHSTTKLSVARLGTVRRSHQYGRLLPDGRYSESRA